MNKTEKFGLFLMLGGIFTGLETTSHTLSIVAVFIWVVGMVLFLFAGND